ASSPRVFSSYRFFARLLRSRPHPLVHHLGWGPILEPRGPSTLVLSLSATAAPRRSAQFVAANTRTENAARKSTGNIRTNRQLQGAWPDQSTDVKITPKLDVLSQRRTELFRNAREAFLDHERAKSELKALMPDDAKEAIGHGVRAKRSRSGAVSFDVLEREATHASVQ